MPPLVKTVIGLVLPPRCPGCGAVVGEDHRFCSTCWSSLRFLAPPACAGCGVPFEHDRGEDARCADCLSHPPRHNGIFAAVAYGDVARTVALRLKHGGRIALAETAARLMVRRVPADTTLLVPVPLHRWRLWKRGYNQAGLLAERIGHRAGLPVAHRLERRRATPMLRGMGPRERATAVRAAFALAEDVRGERVALIDDVYTSGATTDACIATLLRGGAQSVAVVTWARVLDGDD